jgi:SsrA-binding protein
VKSIRHGEVSLAGAYATVLHGELWLVGADVAAYKFGNRFNHNPKSQRKLLVHARELRDLKMKTEAKGLTLVPLKMYFKDALIKVELGLCQGKHTYDKKRSLMEKDVKREKEREIKNYR